MMNRYGILPGEAGKQALPSKFLVLPESREITDKEIRQSQKRERKGDERQQAVKIMVLE